MTKHIGVVGLGYVGLPLAVALSAKHQVFGFDTDEKRVHELMLGRSYIPDVKNHSLGNFTVHREMDAAEHLETIIVCLPTPLDAFGGVDTSILDAALKNLGQIVKPGTLIILESTIPVGYTAAARKKWFTPDIHLAFSPERVDPGNENWNIKNTPKLVSGLTDDAAMLAYELYSTICDDVIYVSSEHIRECEAAKLFENTFRLVNISLVNELVMKSDLDVVKLIDLAATKPFGFMPFYPSIGAGGHCIPVDPLYLNYSVNSKIISLAATINSEMPRFYAEQLNVVDRNVVVAGISYKPNCADTRESKAVELCEELIKKGAKLWAWDPIAEPVEGIRMVRDQRDLPHDVDVLYICSRHKSIGREIDALAERVKVVIDANHKSIHTKRPTPQKTIPFQSQSASIAGIVT